MHTGIFFPGRTCVQCCVRYGVQMHVDFLDLLLCAVMGGSGGGAGGSDMFC